MFTNVLVGVDEDQGGRDAVALARRLIAMDGELTLAYIFHEWLPGHRERTFSDALREDEHARELLERASAETVATAHLRWRGAASVGRGLHELAETTGADLLVVGSSQRGLVGHAALTDDTRAALNGAPCAVAVAPIGYSCDPPAPMREIGVGYDESPESEHALGVARRLAAEMGSKLSAFEVVTIPWQIYAGSGARVRASAIHRAIDSARKRIGGLGGVEPHAAYGDPVVELTLYSASLDLLVVGSRSYGPVGRLVHGSTAQHLTHTARCPLLVLTRAARRPSSSGAREDREEALVAAG